MGVLNVKRLLEKAIDRNSHPLFVLWGHAALLKYRFVTDSYGTPIVFKDFPVLLKSTSSDILPKKRQLKTQLLKYFFIYQLFGLLMDTSVHTHLHTQKHSSSQTN